MPSVAVVLHAIVGFGASLGGYHAANTLLRYPHLVKRCYAFSGVYDLRRFMDGLYDDNFYFHNPVDYAAHREELDIRRRLLARDQRNIAARRNVSSALDYLGNTLRENQDLATFKRRILGKDYFVMDQWQLEELAKVVAKCKVKVVTNGLPPETVRQCFVEPAPTVEHAIADSLCEYGPNATIAVIPKGPYVMPSLA